MKKLFFLLFTFISFPLFASRSIVILPFSDESKTQQVYWLGEGFSESLSEEMFLKNAFIIERPERRSAYDALRIPYVGNLSRATMLKIGENLGADFIVFGTYTVEEKSLTVESRVIETASSKLSSPIQASGTLDGLYTVQSQIKEQLQNYFAFRKLEPIASKPETSSIPLHAYELYMKGLLETSEEAKARFFQRAIDAHPGYYQAIYRLALSRFRAGRFQESNAALEKLPGDGAMRLRVDFLIGLNHYYIRDLTSAAQKWYQLSQAAPTPEIYNNIGISLVGKNEMENANSYLTRAIELDTDHPDFRFNLGIASYKTGNFEQSSKYFREAVELRPSDYQAMYLLAKSLESEKKPESKVVFKIFQDLLPADQKGKFPEQFPEVLRLLRPSLSYMSVEEKNYTKSFRQKLMQQRADYLKTYQGSARKQVSDKHADRAIQDIKKGMTFAPLDWYLHHLWGLALIDQQNQAAGIEHLEFSIWCMENIDSHILLAEIYRDSQKFAESKRHIQEVLALDPKHKKAIEIWSKIYNKS